MTTHNALHYSDASRFHDRKTSEATGLGSVLNNSSEVQENPVTASAGIFAYLSGLASVAVVTITGQFPWFLLTLAIAAAVTSAYPRIRHNRVTADADKDHAVGKLM